jgi:hypothetical protein
MSESMPSRQALLAETSMLRDRLSLPRLSSLLEESDQGRDVAERFRQALSEVEKLLTDPPAYQLALLGTTRAGKSTLVNALLGIDLLPTSYTKPCTSGVIVCAHSDSPSLTIEYESLEAIDKARRQALVEAERLEQENSSPEAKKALERFRVLMDLPGDLTASELINQVRAHDWRETVKSRAGQTETIEFGEIAEIKEMLKDLLSSEGQLWPMVLQCRIESRFPVLEGGLQIVDLPGTNDPDLARTQLTRQFVRTVRALAIVTSSSNIGTDIQDAVSGADVLDRLMEGTERSRLNLMVIRTHLSAVHPPETEDGADEYETYKREQTSEFRGMLEKLVAESVSAPLGADEQYRMDKVKSSIQGTDVFFVDSLAACVLEGIVKPAKKAVAQIQAWSEGDPAQTGIPQLRVALNGLAQSYASSQYYPDVRSKLEKAKVQVDKFFRDRRIQAQSNMAICRAFATKLASRLKSELLPWIESQAAEKGIALDSQAKKGRAHLEGYLKAARQNAGVRFEDKKRIWVGYYWNTMRCVGRSEGRFWSSSRGLIDINDDIKEVLVDSMRVAWPVFRDSVVRGHTIAAAQEFENLLRQKLQVMFYSAPSDLEQYVELQQRAIDAIEQAIEEQRSELISRIDGKVEDFVSLQKPVYEVVRHEMSDGYRKIAAESGPGCSDRMRTALLATFQAKRGEIEQFVTEKVGRITASLMEESAAAFQDLAASIADAIMLLANALEAPSRFQSEVDAEREIAWYEEARLLWSEPAHPQR